MRNQLIKKAGKSVKEQRKIGGVSSQFDSIRLENWELDEPILSSSFFKYDEPITTKTKKEPVPALNPESLQEHYDIPQNYDASQITLMARDPYWFYAYWEVSLKTINELKKKLGDHINNDQLTIRCYDVTMKDFNGQNANSFFDYQVGAHVRNYYINLWSDNISLVVDLGIKTDDGSFYTIARSNEAKTPRASTSSRSDMIWMDVKDHRKQQFAYVNGRKKVQSFSPLPRSTSTQVKRSSRKMTLTEDDIRAYYMRLVPLLRRTRGSKSISELADDLLDQDDGAIEQSTENALNQRSNWSKKILTAGASKERLQEGGASDQIFSGASEHRQRQFFFEIGAELIVYGRTEPHATVWLQDQEISLRPDGTFSLRYALPDGKIPFDFKARSYDQFETRRILTSVERMQTKYYP